MRIVNLMSDTVTLPTPEMLEAMMNAQVGDDVFKEDPSVNALQEQAADMFGKEAALFCPSGTMTNQIAIKVHTNPLDEVICNENSHVYQYETGGYAFHSGVSMRLLSGKNGKITADQVAAAIKPLYDWLPKSKLVIIENTCNKGGGTIYTLDEMRSIATLCQEKQLKIHLDGARLFNALVETGDSTTAIGNIFDSISLCLSKGLGAPVGSLLLGEKDYIAEARRFRKVMGGGMRQAGYMAAAGIYALKHNISRLREDHQRAKAIGKILKQMPYVGSLLPIETNIVIFDILSPFTSTSFIDALGKYGIKCAPFGPQTVRFVTHMQFTDDMLTQLTDALESLALKTVNN